MRTFAAALALVLGVATSARTDEAVGLVEGRWFVAHRVYTPTEANKSLATVLESLGTKVEIGNGKLKSCEAGNSTELSVTIDPSTAPANIDVRIPGTPNDTTLLGTYVLESGTILVVTINAEGNRPTLQDNPTKEIRLILRRAP